MAKQRSVSLSSNGKYWLARYYDSLGRRKGKVLGAKANLSRRQALVLCERLAVELHNTPAKGDLSKAPTLAQWLTMFLALKPDLGDRGRRAYTIACDRLAAFVGEHTRIDRITPAIAAEWVAKLASTTVPPPKQADPAAEPKYLSPATVANYSRHVRCLFNEAVHQGILATNPFARIRTQPKRIERKWHYVDRKCFARILDACPTDGWRCFLALQRLGGLRKGESLAVTWGMVDLDRRVLVLPETITKTGQERTVPLEPTLAELLSHAKAGLRQGGDPIVPKGDLDRSSDSNQHSRFRTILKNAGIDPWEDLFQTLRRNAIQDLRETLKDPWAVTAIAGHSEEVQRKYYLGRIRQSDLDRITGADGETETRALMELWTKLAANQRGRLVAILRAAMEPAQTGTKTGTKTGTNAASSDSQHRGKNEKEPANTGSNQSAPRRTRTFNPLIKSRSDGVSGSARSAAQTPVNQELVDWLRTELELP